MKKRKYEVQAHCSSRVCKGKTFTVYKDQILKKSTSGAAYRIENVVCPDCKMWADVISIKRNGKEI